MIYPDTIELKLGFSRIRELLKERCLSNLGESFVQRVQFLTNSRQIEQLLAQTEDFRRILISEESFPSANYLDISHSLEKIKIAGSFLGQQEMYDVGMAMNTVLACIKFFQIKGEDYPHLHKLSAVVDFDQGISQEILIKFDEKANIKDNASKELMNIRAALAKHDKNLRKIVDGLLRKAKEDGYSPGDGQVSVRDGRLVIPVMAESKRRIRGVVQDESATGHTAYVEPTQAIEINNEISDLRYKERREIIKILTALSDIVRPEIPALLKANHFLGMIDFIRAKGKLAIDLECCKPALSKDNHHQLVKARHPLLMINHLQLGKPVVPLNCELSKEGRILVISGPNAGGKSVSLKTVGLLQYMFQCGLLLPVAESSTLKVFKQLFIDIGDEQSIENDLSTYSSHLKNLRHFVEHANQNTLFLIDEFGTGTEPQFGGSIAEVILDKLNRLTAYGIVTTHYTNLKKMADAHEGIINGAMRFDVEKLNPQYILDIGKPGSSFALEIAGSIGLPKELIQKAKKLVGHSQVKFEELVNQLEFEKNQYKEKLADVTKKEKLFDREQQDYQDLKEHLEEEKKSIINRAKREADQLINEANKEIERVIKGIKESKADKDRTRKLRKELTTHQEQVKPKKEENKRRYGENTSPAELRVGDKVKIKGQESVGELVAMKGKKAEVMLGAIKSLVEISKLEPLKTSEKITYNRSGKVKGIDYVKKAANFSPNIDLRGNRAEEVVSKLDSLIDEAILLGVDELRIIHGKGNGVLREVVRNYLRDYSQVERIEDEHVEQGGAGVSIVKLA